MRLPPKRKTNGPNMDPVDLSRVETSYKWTKNLTTLIAMAEKQQPQWHDLTKNEQVNKRQSNKEAALITSRGDIPTEQCKNCQIRPGPFTECVVVDGMFRGGCNNCQWNSEGRHCSFSNNGQLTAEALTRLRLTSNKANERIALTKRKEQAARAAASARAGAAASGGN